MIDRLLPENERLAIKEIISKYSTKETNKKASMRKQTKQRKGLEVDTTKMVHVDRKAPVHLKPLTNLDTSNKSEVKPRDRPAEVISKLFHLLEHQDPHKRSHGLKVVHALAERKPDILLPSLHDVCLAVLREVDNRYSTLTHAAILTMTHLFAHLRNDMDNECQITATVLLDRLSESPVIIREAVDLALSEMVYNCSPVHVTNALLQGGISHVDPLVRTHMVQCLFQHIQIAGISHMLTGKRNTTRCFLSALNKLALDSEEEVSSVAENIIVFSDIEREIPKMIDILLPENERLAIKEIISKYR
ncbi:uncharacterized protein LOC131344551 [Hemibagrus wyckioides]|uniref:uncharacterized protein LOC131344551 n=1 Tax=Hemibagrus wyckioides TaxID=337641 RepID=UPI00266CD294|nr:uncharacterized protein LOC131344551 [Hemibagrus wyckioides]